MINENLRNELLAVITLKTVESDFRCIILFAHSFKSHALPGPPITQVDLTRIQGLKTEIPGLHRELMVAGGVGRDGQRQEAKKETEQNKNWKHRQLQDVQLRASPDAGEGQREHPSPVRAEEAGQEGGSQEPLGNLFWGPVHR